MSASSKKKLRNEQSAEKMTQRQLAEQKEAKKLKLYTTTFCVVIAVLMIVAAVVAGTRFIEKNGLKERHTVAATVGSHELTSAELNYFYVDAVNAFTQQYGSYLAYMIDVTKPLDQLIMDPATGATWADYFMDTALNNAASVYAVADAAKAAGYTLSAEEITQLDIQFGNMEIYAQAYGYPSVDSYLKSMYGNGATEEGYREYMELTLLANSYHAYYAESLTYDDAALRAAEADNMAQYNNYTFHYYYVNVADYYKLQPGTIGEDGVITYSDEEKAASQAAAEADANNLASGVYLNANAFDGAIGRLDFVHEGAKSTLCEEYSYGGILALLQPWVTSADRQPGDLTCIANESTTTAEDGTQTTTINGYYVVYYVATGDNNYPLANVRHVLIPYEGGTYDATTYTTIYSDEEKAAAETEAQTLLDQWFAGDMTEESFAALANANSADSDGTDGGLYTDIVPGQMVPAFEEWCFADQRVHGDTGLVHTEYGCHIMYYSGDSETLYRDYLIAEDLRAADLQAWNESLLANYPTTKVNTEYVMTDIVLGGGVY